MAKIFGNILTRFREIKIPGEVAVRLKLILRKFMPLFEGRLSCQPSYTIEYLITQISGHV